MILVIPHCGVDCSAVVTISHRQVAASIETCPPNDSPGGILHPQYVRCSDDTASVAALLNQDVLLAVDKHRSNDAPCHCTALDMCGAGDVDDGDILCLNFC